MKSNLFSSILIHLFFFYFRTAFSQNCLPVLEHHNLYETKNQYVFVWLNQNTLNGSWIIEHSFNGLNWNILNRIKTSSSIYYYNLSKNLYGFIRLRWNAQKDTTTLIVHNLNHANSKGLFASYDEKNCKILIGYQVPYQTDLLLRLYNSTGEEIATHFLYHTPNEIYFWNFEPQNLKKDIYLVRLVDALTKEILSDYRLPILYDLPEKKPN